MDGDEKVVELVASNSDDDQRKLAHVLYDDYNDEGVEFDYTEFNGDTRFIAFYDKYRLDSNGKQTMKLTMMVNMNMIRSISLHEQTNTSM